MTDITLPESAAGRSSSSEVPPPDVLRNVRDLIQAAIKSVRQELDKTQTEFAKEVLSHDTRFGVVRLENGDADLSIEQAERIDAAVELHRQQSGSSGISLLPLVEHRERLQRATTGADGRQALIGRMLAMPGIERVRVVLGDDLPLATLVTNAGHVERLEVVVPTPARSLAVSRRSVLEGLIVQQVNTLLDNMGEPSVSGRERHLRITESDEVDFSIVHSTFEGGAEVAWWPSISLPEVESDDLPVASSADPRICTAFQQRIDELIRFGRELQPFDLVVSARPGADGQTAAALTNVASRVANDLDGGELYAVALVLLHSYTADPSGIGRRLIIYRRLKSQDANNRLSLVSSRVEERDLRTFLNLSDDDPANAGAKDPAALAIRLGRALLDKTASNEIPEEVYKLAAIRELQTQWNLDVDSERLELIPLTGELGKIEKGSDQGFVPRLFHLEVDREGGATSGLELTKLLKPTSKYYPETVGAATLIERQQPMLNDFLSEAIQSGTMRDILNRLKIERW